MKYLKELAIAGAISLSSFLYQNQARGEEANLSGLVEKLEKKEGSVYGDLRDYMLRDDELPKGFQLISYGEFPRTLKIGRDKEDWKNPLYLSNDKLLSSEGNISEYRERMIDSWKEMHQQGITEMIRAYYKWGDYPLFIPSVIIRYGKNVDFEELERYLKKEGTINENKSVSNHDKKNNVFFTFFFERTGIIDEETLSNLKEEFHKRLLLKTGNK